MHEDLDLATRALHFEMQVRHRTRLLLERVVRGIEEALGNPPDDERVPPEASERLRRIVAPAKKFLEEPCPRCGGTGDETCGYGYRACERCDGRGVAS